MGIYDDRTYIIIPIGDVTQAMIDACIQTSFDTLRLNIAETHTILKWSGDTPSGLSGYTPYTHAEITAHINNPANGWIEEEE
jgi:hypothetical protein